MTWVNLMWAGGLFFTLPAGVAVAVTLGGIAIVRLFGAVVAWRGRLPPGVFCSSDGICWG